MTALHKCTYDHRLYAGLLMDLILNTHLLTHGMDMDIHSFLVYPSSSSRAVGLAAGISHPLHVLFHTSNIFRTVIPFLVLFQLFVLFFVLDLFLLRCLFPPRLVLYLRIGT